MEDQRMKQRLDDFMTIKTTNPNRVCEKFMVNLRKKNKQKLFQQK